MDSLVQVGWERSLYKTRNSQIICYRILADKYHHKMLSFCSPVTSLLEGIKCPTVVQLKENLELITEKEWVSKFYPTRTHLKKLSELTTYYKYHQEVPRLFMKEKSEIIHEYYDTRRRLIYEQIKRMLASEHIKEVKVIPSSKESRPQRKQILSPNLERNGNKGTQLKVNTVNRYRKEADEKRTVEYGFKQSQHSDHPGQKLPLARESGDGQTSGHHNYIRVNQQPHENLMPHNTRTSPKNSRVHTLLASKKLRGDTGGDRILTESILAEHLRLKEMSADQSYHFDPHESRLLSPEEPQSSSTLLDIKSRLNEAFGYDDSMEQGTNILGIARSPEKAVNKVRNPTVFKSILDSPQPAVSCSMQSNLATRQSSQLYDHGYAQGGIRGLLEPGHTVHNLIVGNSVNVNVSVNPVSASQTNRRKGVLKQAVSVSQTSKDHKCSLNTCPLCLGPIPAASNGFSKKKMASKLAALGQAAGDIGKLIPNYVSKQVCNQVGSTSDTEGGLFRSNQKQAHKRPVSNMSLSGVLPNSSKAEGKSGKQRRHHRTNTSGGYPAVVSTLFSANFDDSKTQTVINRSSQFPATDIPAKNFSMIQKIFNKKHSLNPSKVVRSQACATSGVASLRKEVVVSRTRALRTLLVPESPDSLQNFNLMASKPQQVVLWNNPSVQPFNLEPMVCKKKGLRNTGVANKKPQRKPSKVHDLFENKRMSNEFAMSPSQNNPFSHKHLSMNTPIYTGVLGSLGYPNLDRPARTGMQTIAPKAGGSLYASQLWDSNPLQSYKLKQSGLQDDRLSIQDNCTANKPVARLFGKKRSDPVPKQHSTSLHTDTRGIFERKKRSVDNRPQTNSHQTASLPMPTVLSSELGRLGVVASDEEPATEVQDPAAPLDTAAGGDWGKKMLIKKKKKQSHGSRKATNISVVNYESLIRNNNFFKFKSVVRGERNQQPTSLAGRSEQRGLVNRSNSSHKGSKSRATSPKYLKPDLRTDYQLPEPTKVPFWSQPSPAAQGNLKEPDAKILRALAVGKPLNLLGSLSSNRRLREQETTVGVSKPGALMKHSRHESDKLERRHVEQSDLSSCESGLLDPYGRGDHYNGTDISKNLRRQDKKLLWTPVNQSIPKHSSYSVQVANHVVSENGSIDNTGFLQQRSVVCEKNGPSKHQTKITTPNIPNFLAPKRSLASKQSGKVDKSQGSQGIGRSSQQCEASQAKCSPYLLFESSEHPLQRHRSKPHRSGQR